MTFMEAYPEIFYGVNTWWVRGVEDWQFIYDHLDDYHKFMIKARKLPHDPLCPSNVHTGFCSQIVLNDDNLLYDYYDDNTDYWISSFENNYGGYSY